MTKSDWTRTLLSVGFGFVAGICSEPIKFRIGTRLKTRQAVHDFHRHLVIVLHYLRTYIEAFEAIERHRADGTEPKCWELGNMNWLDSLDTEVFDYYFEDDKGLFYRLPSAFLIRQVYRDVKCLQDGRLSALEKRDIAVSIRSSLCCELNGGFDLSPELMFKFGKQIFGSIEEDALRSDFKEYEPKPPSDDMWARIGT